MKKTLLLATFVFVAIALHGKVRLPALFSDGVVLQQQTKVNFWGWAEKGKTVTVTPSWNKIGVRTTVAGDGKWALQLETPATKAGVSWTITVSDGEAVTIKDVLLGEVWVCSGQSNMGMPLSGTNGQPVRGSLQETLASARYGDLIHVIDVPKTSSDTPLDNFEGKWLAASPVNAPGFSAAAWFFARNVADVLGIPVGIVTCAWGGSNIEAWMDEASVAKIETPEELAALRTTARENQALSKLYKGMLNAIAGYTARGFVWYQGEANVKNPHQYAALMRDMVALWRQRWNDAGNAMPFYYVQIAPYSYGDSNGTEAAKVVEAQINALKMIPNSGLAGTTDVGEEFCIHPAAKDVVGFRLALLALRQTYAVLEGDVTGPLFKDVKFEKGTAKVTFTNVADGLYSPGKEVAGFEMAGRERVFYPATAVIRGATVSVTCEKVAEPVAVRYAFRNFLLADLHNTRGLPAFPFRSDDW